MSTYDTVIDALGNPSRREIFERLRAGPQAVGELAAGLPISRPAVSQHLKILKDAGLVQDRPLGTRRIYQLEPTGLEALRAYVDDVWDTALRQLKHEAEANEREARHARTNDPGAGDNKVDSR